MVAGKWSKLDLVYNPSGALTRRSNVLEDLKGLKRL
jgi:hypothetical protein